MTELQIIALVIPTIALVAVGWGIVRINLFSARDADVLSTLFLHVCAPALIIAHLAKQDLATLVEPAFILATMFLMLVLYGGVFLVQSVILKRGIGVSAFAAFAGAKFNAVVVGFPVLFATVGFHAIVTMTINVVVGYFTILPLTLLLANLARSAGGNRTATHKIFLSSLWKALTHPLVVATIVGLLLAGGRVTLPGWIDKSLVMLGEGAIPTALLAVGMSLNTLSFRENTAEIVWVSAVRVILSPALAFLVAELFGLSPVFAVALVISFSLPTAKMVLPLADENHTYVKQAAGIIALTTISLIVVWPVIIWVCERLWPGIIAGTG